MGRLAMEVTERLQKLYGPMDHMGLAGNGSPLQDPVHALSLDVIHDRINNAVLLDKIVHLGNIRVAQALQHVHFPPEHLFLCI